MPFESRLREIRDRIARAAERSGRPASAITLIAVSKTVGAETVRAACDAGIRDFGESRAQELVAKASALRGLPLRWHFIGHLQRNKVPDVVPIASLVHSVDSVRLARRIAETAGAEPVDCLLQVNTSGEESKFGAAPDELDALLREARDLGPLRIGGLMTLGPLTEDEEAIRASFRLLRRLAERAREEIPEATILSMGMSGDFEIAIEEGATHVRIGTALFGPREAPTPR